MSAFKSEDGKWFLIKCYKCSKENWGPAVATGQCAWCGFDKNKEPDYTVSD